MSLLRPPFLKVVRFNQDIRDVELVSPINSHIGFRRWSTKLVPAYEEHAVRQNIGYTIEAWYKLSPNERAFEVAVSRLTQEIKAHQGDAEQKYMDSKRKK